MKKVNIIISISIFILNGFFSADAQRIFYAPGFEKYSNINENEIGQINYSVYLLGDIKIDPDGRKNLKTFKSLISKEGSNSAVVLLGDIIYPLGMPDSSEINFSNKLEYLNTILSTFDNYKGRVFITAGNHDWARGRKQGYEHLQNLENHVKNYKGHKIDFLPKDGCPGPVEIALTPDITLIIIDSQWWLHQNNKPSYLECGLSQKLELFSKTEDILKRNKDKKVIVAAHHPLYSVGEHGGFYPFKANIFPLTALIKNLYIPLPGFIYTGYRKYFGDIQDIAHPLYKEYRESLMEIFNKYPNIIYASGHEHNMQYLEKNNFFHIVSGGGGRGSYISKNRKNASFAYENCGLTKLSFNDTGDVWISYYIPNDNYTGKILFQKKLYHKPIYDEENKLNQIDNYNIPTDSVLINISDKYSNASKFHMSLLGKNYREIWTTKVKFPVFDIGKEKGGLKIIKRGGGMQTMSIRLEGKNKKQYVLRSVDKNIEKVLPYAFRNTIVQKPLQDAISASHPYAPLTLPTMEDAVGIMHTNPKLVWIPDDPRLGIYREDMANKVFLFEERPSGNWENADFFQNSKKIVSTDKTLKKIITKQKHKVDQKAVLKARLFDMFINDWDRHEDQWRWATFKSDSETIYKPIPRDRDQAYFTNQGLIMWFVSQKWVTGKYQGLDYPIKSITGLNYNARFFDRTFLTELDFNDWKSIINQLKSELTDSVIHRAMLNMPEVIYKKSGIKIEEKLKVRRDSLANYAKEYYRILSKAVDIAGTDDNEYFSIKRKANGDTKVDVYALDKNNDNVKRKIFSRLFKIDETNEIRLYGLEGKDIFKLTGRSKKGIKIRIIGGKGKDTVIDSSYVKGLKKYTIVYDRIDKKNTIIKGKETKLKLSHKKSINEYNRKQFKYNQARMFFKTGYNIDDGIFLGAGINIKRFNFRDSILHKIQGEFAFLTGAFSLSYNGLYTAISQSYDLSLDAEISIPRSVDNFYGLGNETIKYTDDKKYYRLRYKYAFFNPMLKKNLSKNFNYAIGTFYQHYEVTDTSNRFIGNKLLSHLDDSAFEAHYYTGLNAKISYDTRNSKLFPYRGINWINEISTFLEFNNENDKFIKFQSELSLFLSFRNNPRVVFALRFGGAKNYGDYQFFHSNSLGRKTNLRGFRNNRFAGDSYLFHNVEMRLKLKEIRSYVLNGSVGITIFNDIGRVWYKDDISTEWHNGYGAEFWLIPFDSTVLSLRYNRSVEDEFVDFKFSYLF